MNFIRLTTENVDLIPNYIGYSVVFRNNLKNPQMETIIGFSVNEKTVSIKITNTKYQKTNRLNICRTNKNGNWENAREVYLISPQ